MAGISKELGVAGAKKAWAWLGALVCACLLLLASPVRAEIGDVQGWDLDQATEVLRHKKMVLRYAPSLADEAEDLIDAMPGWWKDLEYELGQDLSDDLTVHFVTHAGQVAAATGMPKWVSGVANGARGEIAIAYHNPDGSRADLASLLRHEMAHVALRRSVRGAKLPRWFHEGVADGLGAEIDLGRAQTLVSAASGAGVLPLSSWDAALMSEGDIVSNTYAVSRDFVKHLRYSRDDGQTFRKLIDRLSKGGRFEASIQETYAQKLDALFDEWEASLRDRFFWYAMMASGSLPMVFGAPLLALAWRKKSNEKAVALKKMEEAERAEQMFYEASRQS